MIIERTELVTPALANLLDFWLAKCNGQNPPVSSDIAPTELREWKDNLAIFEVIGDEDFVYCYYGQALVAAFGESRLGATLDALPDAQRALLAAEYATARRERLPMARVHTADFGGIARSFERLVLPLSSDGETVDKLLVAAYEIAPAAATPPVGATSEEGSESPAPEAPAPDSHNPESPTDTVTETTA